MKLALIYGEFCCQIHGGFSIPDLFVKRGLTGSESFFFNTARGLAERGHSVGIFCPTPEAVLDASNLGGALVFPISKLDPSVLNQADAVIAWNEPNYLRSVQGPLRVCVQQLNDFRSYCPPDWDSYVDRYFFPSEAHRAYMIGVEGLSAEKCGVVPNSIDLSLFADSNKVTRDPAKVVYCSSPDRGLHWLMQLFPQVRSRVPEATLKVFYRFRPWHDQVRENDDEIGRRARYIDACIKRVGEAGENGITFVGPVSNVEMARELMSAGVFAYPCDTARYTEGFSVATLDACASGVVPIVSDRDALGSIYKDVVHQIPGSPGDHADEWVDAIIRGIKDEDFQHQVSQRARAFAATQGFPARAETWERILEQAVAAQGSPITRIG